MIKVLSLLGSHLTYPEIWNLQKSLVEKVARREHDETIIFCEHETTITAGRRAKAENLLHAKCPVYEIERGGDFTLHSPGQLVIYPILRLTDRFAGIKEYLNFCENVLIDFLILKGLNAGRFGPTGVWIQRVDGKVLKIASVGISVRKWITYHGMALNVSNDLRSFGAIRPCDFDSAIMTSLQDQGIEMSLSSVQRELLDLFRDHLNSATAEFELVADPSFVSDEAHQLISSSSPLAI